MNALPGSRRLQPTVRPPHWLRIRLFALRSFASGVTCLASLPLLPNFVRSFPSLASPSFLLSQPDTSPPFLPHPTAPLFNPVPFVPSVHDHPNEPKVRVGGQGRRAQRDERGRGALSALDSLGGRGAAAAFASRGDCRGVATGSLARSPGHCPRQQSDRADQSVVSAAPTFRPSRPDGRFRAERGSAASAIGRPSLPLPGEGGKCSASAAAQVCAACARAVRPTDRRFFRNPLEEHAGGDAVSSGCRWRRSGHFSRSRRTLRENA